MNKHINHISISIRKEHAEVVLFNNLTSNTTVIVDKAHLSDLIMQVNNNDNYALDRQFTFTYEGMNTETNAVNVYPDRHNHTGTNYFCDYVTKHGIVYIDTFNKERTMFSGYVIASTYEEAILAVDRVIVWRSNEQ